MKQKNKNAVALGKKGGMKNKKKGKKYFASIGKKGASSRWKDKKPSTSTVDKRLP